MPAKLRTLSPSEKADKTGKWAVIMTKVRIRQAVAKTPYPRWQLMTFLGPNGAESRGIVDLIAIRKDHSKASNGLMPGDALRMILIQAKGGDAAKPTENDKNRLRIVAGQHAGCAVLLAAWRAGKAARFFSLPPRAGDWVEVTDLRAVFS
jgi:hypothetical protein